MADFEELRTSVVLDNDHVNQLKRLERYKGRPLSEILRDMIKAETEGTRTLEAPSKPFGFVGIRDNIFDMDATSILKSCFSVSIVIRDFRRWLLSHNHISYFAHRIAKGLTTKVCVLCYDKHDHDDLYRIISTTLGQVDRTRLKAEHASKTFRIEYGLAHSANDPVPHNFITMLFDDHVSFSHSSFFHMGFGLIFTRSKDFDAVAKYEEAMSRIFSPAKGKEPPIKDAVAEFLIATHRDT